MTSLNAAFAPPAPDERVFVDALRFGQLTATTLALAAARWPALVLGPDTDGVGRVTIMLPEHWASTYVDVLWSNPTDPSTTVVRWRYDAAAKTVTEALGTDTTGGMFDNRPAGAKETLQRSRFQATIPVKPGGITHFRISRQGTGVEDTHLGDIHLLGVMFTRAT